MADFPTLKPTSFDLTEGDFVTSSFLALGGGVCRWLHNTLIVNCQLRMTFTCISAVEARQLRGHYLTQQGSYLAFRLPPEVTNGLVEWDSLLGSGHAWVYTEPPRIEDLLAAPERATAVHNALVSLRSVPEDVPTDAEAEAL